jgi:hypothetical protein
LTRTAADLPTSSMAVSLPVASQAAALLSASTADLPVSKTTAVLPAIVLSPEHPAAGAAGDRPAAGWDKRLPDTVREPVVGAGADSLHGSRPIEEPLLPQLTTAVQPLSVP